MASSSVDSVPSATASGTVALVSNDGERHIVKVEVAKVFRALEAMMEGMWGNNPRQLFINVYTKTTSWCIGPNSVRGSYTITKR